MAQLPPQPIVQYAQTPDTAKADTIGKMTTKDAIEQLGNIDSDNDVQRLAFLISIGEDLDIGMPFTKQIAFTELALTNSLRTKQGGIRSEHLVRITKEPDMMNGQNEGIIQRIRSKFGR